MKPNDEDIQNRIRRETDARMRDHNKAEAEKNVAKALAHVKRAFTLYTMAECPAWAEHMQAIGELLKQETI